MWRHCALRHDDGSHAPSRERARSRARAAVDVDDDDDDIDVVVCVRVVRARRARGARRGAVRWITRVNLAVRIVDDGGGARGASMERVIACDHVARNVRGARCDGGARIDDDGVDDGVSSEGLDADATARGVFAALERRRRAHDGEENHAREED